MSQTIFSEDLAHNRLHITREFAAPLERVWQAWTDSALLDQWWAPKPWQAVTKSMHFEEGGSWLYAMQSPQGEQSWARVQFRRIVPLQVFEASDSFCDEHGHPNAELPQTNWKVAFAASAHGTTVTIDISFASPDDLKKIVEMGFQAGITDAHTNLDALLLA